MRAQVALREVYDGRLLCQYALPSSLYLPMFRRAPRFLATAALVMGTALAQTATAAEAKIASFAVADAVTSVSQCGNRNQGSNKTVQPYRVILGTQNAHTVLFVQWINVAEGIDNAKPVAAHTLSIAEVNNDDAQLVLRNLRCTSHGKGVQITADVDAAKDRKTKRRLRLDVGPALEKYELRFTPALK